MSNYDWKSYEDRPLIERFPRDVLGFRSDQARGKRDISWDWLDRSLPLLPRRGSCPRIFISHRRADDAEARYAAWIANDEGFEVWLDVLEPRLKTANQPLSIAFVIEMALLNCSHLLAVITERTHGSMWVPYEYGRVKEAAPVTDQAGAWLGPGAGTPAEYLHLGEITHNELEIRTWLKREFRNWPKNIPPTIWAAGQPMSKPLGF